MNHQSLEVFWRSDVVASMLLCTDKSIYAAENVKAMARAVCHSTTPIATDELSAAYGYVDLIDIRVIDVSQRDIAHIGGVTALRKVSAAAEASGIRMAPHACEGRIGGIAILHVDDAGPNMLAPEICGFGAAGEKNRVWEDLLGLLPFRLSGGCVTVRPNRGTGVHDKFRFTTLNQIAGFGEDVLWEFENVPQTGLPIDDFGDALTLGRIGLDFTGCAPRVRRRLVLHWAWCHINDAAPLCAREQADTVLVGCSCRGPIRADPE